MRFYPRREEDVIVVPSGSMNPELEQLIIDRLKRQRDSEEIAGLLIIISGILLIIYFIKKRRDG